MGLQPVGLLQPAMTDAAGGRVLHAQAFMQSAGEQGVLLASLGTIAELGERREEEKEFA